MTIIVVMGGSRLSRESMRDFRSFVDMTSREHAEFEEEKMALWTSRVVAGGKSERRGGGVEGGGLRFEPKPE